ncbi:hypothetical protein BO82DRAFT_398257 [Aspergillus uvarum CBS 121591]|uniref:Uncharacterized protein n=1 Tax=Aspergillus uvarum CBS 121591 TaxID=1448315 RepID=A0A319CNE0_9EURO|nr:hypothetical protein BO82DRAFT_398257 [Aspergillus uvarum CBS 121591]PYH85939.1 hypothetical protein BO82DRAFT_398257 [Aspergillus uvarum CBS 121591]
MFVAAIVFMNLALYIQNKRDNNSKEDCSLEDQCSNQHDTAFGLACSLGLLGADHWYAHHWLLAVLKSMWAFLHGVLVLIYRYGGHHDPYAADFPPVLLWLSAFSFLMKIVTIFWYPIDAYLWSTGVYSIPGCLGRIGA